MSIRVSVPRRSDSLGRKIGRHLIKMRPTKYDFQKS